MSLRGFRRPVFLGAGLVCILAGLAVWMKYGPAHGRPPHSRPSRLPTLRPRFPRRWMLPTIRSGSSPTFTTRYQSRVEIWVSICIERYGAQNVEKMVRQYLIEVAAAKVGVFVTPAEIDAE